MNRFYSWLLASLICAASASVAAPLQNLPEFDEGNGIKLLFPVGGETFKYGDTITVKWLQRFSPTFTVTNGMIAIQKGFSRCVAWVFDTDYIKIGANSDPATGRYYTKINDTLYQGNYRLVLVDREFGSCTVVYDGSLSIEVYDEYSQNASDVSLPITVTKSSDIRRTTRRAGNVLAQSGSSRATLISPSGRAVPNPAAQGSIHTGSILNNGVYFIRTQQNGKAVTSRIAVMR